MNKVLIIDDRIILVRSSKQPHELDAKYKASKLRQNSHKLRAERQINEIVNMIDKKSARKAERLLKRLKN